MFDDTELNGADKALRAGLYDLPTPDVSPDFDSRIQAALIQRPGWRQALWTALRPALLPAVWTMAAMLLLLHIAQQPFIETRTLPSLASAHAAQKPFYRQPYSTRGKQSEEELENTDLSYTSLSFFSRPLHGHLDSNG